MASSRFAVSIDTVTAVERLKAATAAVPMGLVAHLDGQANCAKKGITVPPDQILEIFRPDFAVRVWAADKRAGLDIPIRVHVCQHAGQTWVACRMPSQVFAPYACAALDAIGQELDEIFARILAALDDARE
ncbi:MAG: DUF302 domain-containing protein [Sterolibacterium sp.]|jgi:uncharacterized protein (DUF302 family)